jgi:hypothetical protein
VIFLKTLDNKRENGMRLLALTRNWLMLIVFLTLIRFRYCKLTVELLTM